MLLRSLGVRAIRVAIAAAALLVFALPAGAVTYYQWETDEGVVSYTDTQKRIPAKYKGAAVRRSSGNLRGYARYTPSGRAGQGEYTDRMGQRLDALRTEAVPKGPGYRYDPGRANVSLEVPSLRIDLPRNRFYEPVVVEEIQTRPDGSNATRTIRVVRQGERVISVIKPIENERDTSFLPDETGLP